MYVHVTMDMSMDGTKRKGYSESEGRREKSMGKCYER